jgi:hypothetical protein
MTPAVLSGEGPSPGRSGVLPRNAGAVWVTGGSSPGAVCGPWWVSWCCQPDRAAGPRLLGGVEPLVRPFLEQPGARHVPRFLRSASFGSPRPGHRLAADRLQRTPVDVPQLDDPAADEDTGREDRPTAGARYRAQPPLPMQMHDLAHHRLRRAPATSRRSR